MNRVSNRFKNKPYISIDGSLFIRLVESYALPRCFGITQLWGSARKGSLNSEFLRIHVYDLDGQNLRVLIKKDMPSDR